MYAGVHVVGGRPWSCAVGMPMVTSRGGRLCTPDGRMCLASRTTPTCAHGLPHIMFALCVGYASNTSHNASLTSLNIKMPVHLA